MKRNKTDNFTKAVKVFMNHRRLLKRDLKDALGISYETLEKKFRDPRHFTGYDREILSNALDLPLELVDELVNNNLSYQDALVITQHMPTKPKPLTAEIMAELEANPFQFSA